MAANSDPISSTCGFRGHPPTHLPEVRLLDREQPHEAASEITPESEDRWAAQLSRPFRARAPPTELPDFGEREGCPSPIKLT